MPVKSAEERVKIVVFVSGGVVQDIQSTSLVDVIVVDYDVEGTEVVYKLNGSACAIAWWELEGVSSKEGIDLIKKVEKEWKRSNKR